MNRKHLIEVCMLTLVACYSLAGSANSWDASSAPPGLAGSGYGIGDTAYDFTARDQFDDEVSLYQFYGKTIVLDFCTFWCTACQTWSDDLNNQESTLDSMGYAGQYQVLELLFEDAGAAPADQTDATVWVNTFSLDVPVLHTQSGVDTSLVDLLVGYFGVATNLPAFVVIDPQMRITAFDNSSDFDLVTTVVDVSQVPVPAAVWLFASGLIGLLGFTRRSNT